MSINAADVASIRDRAGIVLDFDGTLSEIAPTPEQAIPVPGALDVLTQLRASYRVVAIVSGRTAIDVADRVEHRVRCFGLYGADDQHAPDGGLGEAVATMERIAPEVGAVVATVPGARLEPKGPHLAVHYRLADEPEQAEVVLLDALKVLAQREGLRILTGKRVLELAPPGGSTKGAVLRRLARDEKLEALLYAGDDLADLEAFEAVAGLAEKGTVGVRVAVRSAETPPPLIAQADVVVDGPPGLLAMLREML